MPSDISPLRRRLVLGALALPFAYRLTWPAEPAAASPDGAAQFVRGLIDRAIEVLRLPLDQTATRESRFRQLLLQNFDLPLITQLVVGRYWRSADENQKKAFAAAFEKHIVRVYTSQLGVYQDERVEIRNVAARTDKDTVVATEVIREADPPLRLDWLVREGDGAYKIIDVAAEGVSMMTTKRSEFSSVIAREGIDGLINRLEDLNASGQTDIGES